MQNLVGQTVADRYRVEEFLGRGGMAEVYKVWDQRRATYLAMKLLHEDLALDRVFIRRFKREAGNLARLQHPHIVRFYGLEQEDRLAFMLLDYVEGETLKHKIFDAAGPMLAAEIQKVTRAMCSALQFAHSEGLVHCDIKPANVMFSESGRPMLSDFGIARMTDAATATMVGMGTPAYMAPEQVKGLDPVPQTDIYALGVVLYEMVTGGQRPFVGEQATVTGTTSAKVRWEQTYLRPPSPSRWNSDLKGVVERVILTCLEKSPENRYQTALEVSNALERAAGGSLPQQAREDVSPDKEAPLPAAEEPTQLVEEEPSQVECPACGTALDAGARFCMQCGKPLNGREEAIREKTSENSDIPPDLPQGSKPPALVEDRDRSREASKDDQHTSSRKLSLSDEDEMEFVRIPEGTFLMGGDGEERSLNLDEFWMGKMPVTNRQYAVFVSKSDHTPPKHWEDDQIPEGMEDHPVVNVTWRDAVAFCEWLSGHSGEKIRLPTEAEWEKAARGTDGRQYPWGDEEPDDERCNYSKGSFGTTTEVGLYSPRGDSPYGCADIAGNVWEWTQSLYMAYPYQSDGSREVEDGSGIRVIRGGSWRKGAAVISSLKRNWSRIFEVSIDLGFRCVVLE